MPRGALFSSLTYVLAASLRVRNGRHAGGPKGSTQPTAASHGRPDHVWVTYHRNSPFRIRLLSVTIKTPVHFEPFPPGASDLRSLLLNKSTASMFVFALSCDMLPIRYLGRMRLCRPAASDWRGRSTDSRVRNRQDKPITAKPPASVRFASAAADVTDSRSASEHHGRTRITSASSQTTRSQVPADGKGRNASLSFRLLSHSPLPCPYLRSQTVPRLTTDRVRICSYAHVAQYADI